MVTLINQEQMSYLLYKVTVATRREFSDDEGSIWFDLLQDETYDACYEAFNDYLKHRPNEYLTPALIRFIIRSKAKARLKGKLDAVTPPNGLNGQEYLKWLDAQINTVSSPPLAYDPERPARIEGSSRLEIESNK